MSMPPPVAVTVATTPLTSGGDAARDGRRADVVSAEVGGGPSGHSWMMVTTDGRRDEGHFSGSTAELYTVRPSGDVVERVATATSRRCRLRSGAPPG